MTIARKHLTRQQQFEVAKSIENSGKKGENGYWAYNEGITDQTIADKNSALLVHVQSLRIDLFGKLKPLPGKTTLWDIVNDLKERVEALEKLTRPTQVVAGHVVPSLWLDQPNGFDKN